MNLDKIALKTMAIKARVYNEIRKDLFHTVTEGYIPRNWKLLEAEDKIKLFDKWFELNKEAHRELNAYKSKRKYKAKVLKLREEKIILVDSEITPNFTD